ncbi:MAG TPA: hypothetical protein VGO01_01310 [Bradyrhizobium sp.]|jgi:hypothetical protein|nr:hypothetical protein [Bradyrhizobium sp.]
MTQDAAKLFDADPEAPKCFAKLKTDNDRENAAALYEGLRSINFLVPEEVRQQSCPLETLGSRKTAFLVAGVAKARRFVVLNEFETPNVKFDGIAAGTLEAVRLNAVNVMLKALFFKKIRKLTSDLPSRIVTPIRQRSLNSFYVREMPEIRHLGLGKLSLFKIHAMEVIIEVSDDVVHVHALKIIDVEFHPQRY